jgi:hypothetical protein
MKTRASAARPVPGSPVTAWQAVTKATNVSEPRKPTPISAAFREVLGPGTEAYADLLSSLLIGVTFARTGALAELTREELVGYLVPAIRALLAPAIAAAEGGR